MKKLALFDIDGVIYDGQSIISVIQDQEKKGIITKEMWDKVLLEIEEYKSGRKNYQKAADDILSFYAQKLKGLSYKSIFNLSYSFLLKNKGKFFGYFGRVLPLLKKKYDVFFVTSNLQFIAGAFVKIFGVNDYLSSVAEVKEGKFTGKLELSLAGNKGIATYLIKRYGKVGSIAVGDSENDADMLKKVEYPFVFEPNEKLGKICKDNNWEMINRDNAYKRLMDLI